MEYNFDETSINENHSAYSDFFPSKRSFDATDSVFAWVSVILGYIFCRAFPSTLKPLYSLIFIILLYAATFVILIFKKAKIGKAALAVAASGIMVSLSLFLSGNPVIHIFAFGYGALAYCYFVYTSFENRLESGISSLILIDFIKAAFVVPFKATGGILSAMFSKNNNKFGSVIGKILVGVLIAIIPTAIVFNLLSFDSGFLNILRNIFSFNFTDIPMQVVSIILAVPVGSYIFRLFISSHDKSAKNILTVENCNKTSKNASVAPIITVFAATIPLLFMYVVFFVSQWKYYISGFLGELPENVNYATYARDGFFQLLAVAAINLAVISAVQLFCKKGQKIGDLMIRILTVIICVFTLILISTAISKLVLYINEHGLTPKRVHAFWGMIVLTLIFTAVILKQIVRKIKLIPIGLAISVVMFFALGVSGSDRLIAKYNIDRYIDGSLNKIVVDDLDKLGDAAIPEYIRLEENLKAKFAAMPDDQKNAYRKTYDYKLFFELKMKLENIEATFNYDWYEITLPKILADSALENRIDSNIPYSVFVKPSE